MFSLPESHGYGQDDAGERISNFVPIDEEETRQLMRDQGEGCPNSQALVSALLKWLRAGEEDS